MSDILKEFFHINIKSGAIKTFLDKSTKVLVILILIKVVMIVLNKVIERFFQNQKRLKFGMNEKKANTLSELLKSMLQYVLYFVAIMTIADTIWPNSVTIAFTSVLGVAVGFGSQNLVKDVIAGLLILFEDQFAVGDYITVENKSGVVEALGIRSTKIRDFSGELHIIPNGSITVVTNKTRGDMRALVDVNLPYDEDLDKALECIEKVNQSVLKDKGEFITMGPQVVGVSELGDNGAVIRIVAKTIPMKQWEVENELRKRIKRAFDEENIKLGYSKRYVVNRGEMNDDNKL